MDAKSIDLARRARRGDAEAFGELYELCSRELYSYACCVLGSGDLAQDAVHDAVCSAYSQIASLRSEEAFKAWLFKILRGVLNKHIAEKSRQRATVPINDESEDSLGSAPSNTALKLELSAALDTLGGDERDIVLLSVIGGYKSGEIAFILDCPSGTVRSKLSRALKKLRRELE